MTFLDRLKAHIGSLVLIKTELYWYGGRGWDKNPGRICLVLDVDEGAATFVFGGVCDPAYLYAVVAARTRWAAGRAGAGLPADPPDGATVKEAYALLLIDGEPRWVWMTDVDVELNPGCDQ